MRAAGADLYFGDSPRVGIEPGLVALDWRMLCEGSFHPDESKAGPDAVENVTPQMMRFQLDYWNDEGWKTQTNLNAGVVALLSATKARYLQKHSEDIRDRDNAIYFVTRDGTAGVLQIADNADRSGVKIRYKLVQGETSTMTAANDSSNVQNESDKVAPTIFSRGGKLVVETPGQQITADSMTLPGSNQVQFNNIRATTYAAPSNSNAGWPEPSDLREAKAKLAELEIDYGTNHPTVQKQIARIKELERLTREEPNAPADVREAKAKLAELRVDYAEQNPVVQEALARVKALEQSASAIQTKPAAAPDQSADLKVRFEAAKGITAFTSRDAALAVVARDAARAGNFQIVRDALGQMTAFPERDQAALESARELLRAGRRAEAIEVAKTITSFTQRDSALKELAQ